jgi:hypothetical protein
MAFKQSVIKIKQTCSYVCKINTYKTNDRVTRTPLKPGGELKYARRVSSSCSISDTRRVNLITNPVTSHKRGKDRKVITGGTHLHTEYISLR